MASRTVLDLLDMAGGKELKVLFWNTRSLVRKTQDFKVTISDIKPTVIGICETWLQPSLQLHFPGYNIYRADRQDRRGGGLAIAIKDTIQSAAHVIPTFRGGQLEVMATRVALTSGWSTIVIC